MVALLTVIRAAVTEALLARVVGFLESMGAAMPGFGFLAGGAVASTWSPWGAFAVAGWGSTRLAVWFAVGTGKAT